MIFELNLDHSLWQELEFECDKTEQFAIKSVEEFLSEEIDEEFFNKVKSEFMPDQFRSFENCRGYCRGSVQHGNTMEGYTINDEFITHGVFQSDKFAGHVKNSTSDYENNVGLALVLKCAY